jgi:hypothetical protein
MVDAGYEMRDRILRRALCNVNWVQSLLASMASKSQLNNPQSPMNR